jgi:hypothetical protein
MSPTHFRVGTVLRRTFVALPFVSLLVHLCMLHWVYNAHVYAAFLSPLLLGFAVALGNPAPSKVLKRPDFGLLRALLPAAAVMLSSDAPRVLRLAPLGGSSSLVVSPLMLAGAAAYLVYVYLYLVRYAQYFVAGGVLAMLTYYFGPSPSSVAAGTKQGADWGFSLLRRLVPSTTAGWGVTAVAAAFAFLGIGAAISLRKPPGEDEPSPPSDAPPPSEEVPISGAPGFGDGIVPVH